MGRKTITVMPSPMFEGVWYVIPPNNLLNLLINWKGSADTARCDSLNEAFSVAKRLKRNWLLRKFPVHFVMYNAHGYVVDKTVIDVNNDASVLQTVLTYG